MRVSLAALVLITATAAAPSPHALLTRLLTTPFRNTELPHGFTEVRLSALTLSANGRKHGAIGEVGILLHGPDPDDEIVYEVFPDAAHAIADLHNPILLATTHTAGAVPGLAQSTVIVGSITGKNALGATITDGITDAAAVSGNVLVQAFTASATSTKHGNTAVAIELLHAGIAHLRRLDG